MAISEERVVEEQRVARPSLDGRRICSNIEERSLLEPGGDAHLR